MCNIMDESDFIKSSFIILNQWLNNPDEYPYIYLNSDKTFGLRERRFSLSESFIDLVGWRSYRAEEIADQFDRLFSIVEKSSVHELINFVPNYLFFINFEKKNIEKFESYLFNLIKDNQKLMLAFKNSRKRVMEAHKYKVYLKTIESTYQIPETLSNKSLAKDYEIWFINSKMADLNDIMNEIEESHLFEDPKFLTDIANTLVLDFPDYFIQNLARIPLNEKQEILRVGMRIDNDQYRQIFYNYYNKVITEEELISFREKYLEAQNAIINGTFGKAGICTGSTYSILSNPDLQFDKEFLRKARYIQANHALFINDNLRFKKGQEILANPEAFKKELTKIAKIFLGIRPIDELLEVDKELLVLAKNDSEIYAKLVEIVDQSAYEELLDVIKDKPLAYIKPIGQAVLKMEKNKNEQSQTKKNTEGMESEDAFITDYSKLSGLLLQKLGIRPLGYLFYKKPVQNFASLLKNLSIEKQKGSYNLILYGVNSAHSIYISFDPPSYCDITDTDGISSYPIMRNFDSTDKLIDNLERHLNFNYLNFSKFSLIQCEKI